MITLSIGPETVRYGVVEIPYSNITGAGVGVAQRKFTTQKILLVAFRVNGDPKPRRFKFRLPPGYEGDQLVQGLYARIPDRWHGEAPFFTMTKSLGFSNLRTFTIVAAITAVVVLAVVGWAVTVKRDAQRNAAEPTETAPAMIGAGAPRRSAGPSRARPTSTSPAR